MNHFIRDLSFLVISGFILWLIVPPLIGINLTVGSRSSPTSELLQKRLEMPQGYTISVYAAELPGVRTLRFSPKGDLLASQPVAGNIVLLDPDSDHDGLSDGRHVLIENLDRPYGIDIYNKWLYVAESGSVGRIIFDPITGKTQGNFERIVTNLPTGGNHWSRSLRFGPDGWMYVSVGSSCNVCEENDPRRAAILRFQPDGSQGEIFANGLRNTVGFDWHPGSGRMYGVDNGRDFLGDDFPPCELNKITKGGFYGWPYANGNKIPDPDFGPDNLLKVENSLSPSHEFGAHTAPLGITFLRNNKVYTKNRGAAVVALHGSWNRSQKSGYQVVLLEFRMENQLIVESPLVTGFEVNNDVIGRPVDLVEGPAGSLYLSDDYSGTVYRIDYENI